MRQPMLIGLIAGFLLSTTAVALKVEHRAPALRKAARRTPQPSPVTYTATGVAPQCTSTPYTIPNGGFEDGTFSGWDVDSGLNSTVQITSPGAYGTSNYAANLTLTWKQGGGLLSIDTFPICPAKKYQFEFDYLFPTTVQGCDLSAEIGDGLTPNTLYANAGPWTHYVMAVDAGADTIDYIQFNLECVEYTGHPAVTVLVDNFKLTELPGSTEPNGCPRTSTPMPNGGFESGNLASWAIAYKSKNIVDTVVSPGYNSNHMLQINAQQTANPLNTNFQFYRNVSNLCVGYNYTYSFDYRFQNYDIINYPTFCNLTFEDEYCWTNVDKLNSKDSFREFPPVSNWTTAEITCENIGGLSHIIDFELFCDQVGKNPIYNFTGFNIQFDNFAVKYDPSS